MAVIGAHVLLYTPEPEALRATLRDVVGWEHVDAGDGWLIFALPPAEVPAQPSEGSTQHELYLICDDIEAPVAELRGKGGDFRGEPEEGGYGIHATMVLRADLEVGVSEPRHETAI